MKPFFRASFFMLSLIVLAGRALAADADKPWIFFVAADGGVRIERNEDEFGKIMPGLFEAGWQWAEMQPGQDDKVPADGVRRGEITAPSGVTVKTELRIKLVDKDLQFHYRLIPQADMKLNSLYVRFNFPVASYLGGKYIVDGKEAKFPDELKEVALNEADIKAVDLLTAKGVKLTLALAEATHVIVQDDRKWSERFVVHIGTTLKEDDVWPKGKAQEIKFTLTSSIKISLKED